MQLNQTEISQRFAENATQIDTALERGEEALKRGGLYRDRLNEHFDMLEKMGERMGFVEAAVGDLRREDGRPLEQRLEKIEEVIEIREKREEARGAGRLTRARTGRVPPLAPAALLRALGARH